MNLVVPWCINHIKPIPKIIQRKLVNSWKETLALSNPRKSCTIINWKHQIGCLKMFRLPSVVFIFTKVASVACFCNITYNSSDVVVTCNTFLMRLLYLKMLQCWIATSTRSSATQVCFVTGISKKCAPSTFHTTTWKIYQWVAFHRFQI